MDILKHRAINRVLADLRCGAPVRFRGAEDWLILPAENASREGLDALRARCAPPYLLALGAGRASRLRGEAGAQHEGPVAFTLPPDCLTPDVLGGLADPLVEDRLSAPPAVAETPADLSDALKLAKLAQLLPALIVARAAPGLADEALLTATAQQVRAYPAGVAANLRRVAEANVALHDIGLTRLIAFRPADGGLEHVAIVIGEPEKQEQPLVRLHSSCFTGDLLGSLRCDCGPQLHNALKLIAAEKHGALLYLTQEGRGIGLPNKLRAYMLQDGGVDRAPLDTLDANHALGWEADERDFSVAASMLSALKINRIRLITNNPQKLESLSACGVDIAGQQPNRIPANGVNDQYLETKRHRFGHML